jgi:hypothetical protein
MRPSAEELAESHGQGGHDGQKMKYLGAMRLLQVRV